MPKNQRKQIIIPVFFLCDLSDFCASGVRFLIFSRIPGHVHLR